MINKLMLNFSVMILFSLIFSSCLDDLISEEDEYEEPEKTELPSCDGSSYNGPEFDTQIDSQCKLAYAYSCDGNQEGIDAACEIYKYYQSQNPDIPSCPYCD